MQRQQQWQSPPGVFNSSRSSLFDLSLLSPTATADRSTRTRTAQQQQQPRADLDTALSHHHEQQVAGSLQQGLDRNWDDGLGMMPAASADSTEAFDDMLQQALLASLQGSAASDTAADDSPPCSTRSRGCCARTGEDPHTNAGDKQPPEQRQELQQREAFAGCGCSSSSSESRQCSDRAADIAHASCGVVVTGKGMKGCSSTSSSGKDWATATATTSSSNAGMADQCAAAPAGISNSKHGVSLLERLNSEKYQWSDPLTGVMVCLGHLYDMLKLTKQHLLVATAWQPPSLVTSCRVCLVSSCHMCVISQSHLYQPSPPCWFE